MNFKVIKFKKKGKFINTGKVNELKDNYHMTWVHTFVQAFPDENACVNFKIS